MTADTPPGRPAISDDSAATAGRAEFAAGYLPADDVLAAAGDRARELGLAPLPAATGAALRFLAAVAGARAVVEIGTGVGMAAVWLLRGMRADGVLTTVDAEVEHQRLARETLADAGYASGRVRLIAGEATDVLPRLTDGAYDLVYVDARPGDYSGYLAEARRLLRSGGVVALAGVLRGHVAEAGARDAEAVTLRALLADVRGDERLVPLLLPVGSGLLAAVKTA